MTDEDKARTQDEFQNLLAETTISKNVQNVLNAEGPDGAAMVMTMARFFEPGILLPNVPGC